jgi:hypothetical protein
MEILKPKLTAEPSNYVGKCPVTIKFTGTIEVTGSGGKVKYQFVRSSREKTEPVELEFTSPGAKEVTDTWRLGDVYGWESIRILEPQEMSSDKAEFRINCPQPSPSPSPSPEPSPSAEPGTIPVVCFIDLDAPPPTRPSVSVSVVDLNNNNTIYFNYHNTPSRLDLRLKPPSRYAVTASTPGYVSKRVILSSGNVSATLKLQHVRTQ